MNTCVKDNFRLHRRENSRLIAYAYFYLFLFMKNIFNKEHCRIINYANKNVALFKFILYVLDVVIYIKRKNTKLIINSYKTIIRSASLLL
jgi:hypothetical protein